MEADSIERLPQVRPKDEPQPRPESVAVQYVQDLRKLIPAVRKNLSQAQLAYKPGLQDY